MPPHGLETEQVVTFEGRVEVRIWTKSQNTIIHEIVTAVTHELSLFTMTAAPCSFHPWSIRCGYRLRQKHGNKPALQLCCFRLNAIESWLEHHRSFPIWWELIIRRADKGLLAASLRIKITNWRERSESAGCGDWRRVCCEHRQVVDATKSGGG